MDGQRREIKNAGLFARDGVIEQVGLTAELPATADRILDLRGHILLPGMINCHHHLDQVLTRNLPAGQNTNLFRWLKAHYRIWAARTPEETRTAVLVGCAELARSGCGADAGLLSRLSTRVLAIRIARLEPLVTPLVTGAGALKALLRFRKPAG
jgi:cytosine/adenosine deaminase-related metal-dependent hydrolase